MAQPHTALSDKIIKQFKRETQSTIQVDPDARVSLRNVACQFLQEVAADATQRMLGEKRSTILLRDVVNAAAQVITAKYPTLSVPVFMAKIFKVATFPNVVVYCEGDFNTFQDHLYVKTNDIERVDSSNSLQLKEIREALKKNRKASCHANAFMARAVDYFMLHILDETEKRTLLDRKKRIMSHHVVPASVRVAAEPATAAAVEPAGAEPATTAVPGPKRKRTVKPAPAALDPSDSVVSESISDPPPADLTPSAPTQSTPPEPLEETTKPKAKRVKKAAVLTEPEPVVTAAESVMTEPVVTEPVTEPAVVSATGTKKKRKQVQIDPTYVATVQQVAPKKEPEEAAQLAPKKNKKK